LTHVLLRFYWGVTQDLRPSLFFSKKKNCDCIFSIRQKGFDKTNPAVMLYFVGILQVSTFQLYLKGVCSPLLSLERSNRCVQNSNGTINFQKLLINFNSKGFDPVCRGHMPSRDWSNRTCGRTIGSTEDLVPFCKDEWRFIFSIAEFCLFVLFRKIHEKVMILLLLFLLRQR